jgi:hypothetical protein
VRSFWAKTLEFQHVEGRSKLWRHGIEQTGSMDSGSGVKPDGWMREAEKPSKIVDQASTSVSVTSNAVARTSNRP